MYRCRIVKPSLSSWTEVEEESPGLAANEYHSGMIDRGTRGYVYTVENRDGSKYQVQFALIEIEGHGELVSRIFEYKIWRKGGVKSRRTPTLKDIAQSLGWTKDPDELIAEGWEGEETMDEAHQRKWA